MKISELMIKAQNINSDEFSNILYTIDNSTIEVIATTNKGLKILYLVEYIYDSLLKDFLIERATIININGVYVNTKISTEEFEAILESY